MEIDRLQLQTMIREFWAVDNNSECLKATIIFLRNIGIKDNEILTLWLNSIHLEEIPFIDEEDVAYYNEKLEDTENYYK